MDGNKAMAGLDEALSSFSGSEQPIGLYIYGYILLL
jgi:hypothetical protein